MPRYKIRKSGSQRKYDWSQIKKGIDEGKSNSEIASEVGCTAGYVGDLRWKWDPERLKYCF